MIVAGGRGDLAGIGNQRRQARLNISRVIRDREQHGRRVHILQLADRRRIARQLLNRGADLPVVRNCDGVDVRIVELIEVRRDVGRGVEDVESAWVSSSVD